MSAPRQTFDHDLTPRVAIRPEALRDVRLLDAGEVCALWAKRLLDTGDLTVSERQNLRDIMRQTRRLSTNRSTFATLLELGPRAAHPADAFYGLTLSRAGILRRASYALPSPDEAHVAEEDANRAGNLAQLERKERRTTSTLEALVHAMTRQSLASERLADAEAAASR